MKQESFDIFNKLGNLLFKAADHFYSIYISFDRAGRDGFACMALNESHERWHQGHCIFLYLMDNCDKTPVLEDSPAPAQNYTTEIAALTAAHALDGNILSAFDDGGQVVVEHDPVDIYELGKMKKKLRREYSEVGDVVHRIESAPDRIGEIDAYLKAKYCPLVSGACHRH